MALKVGDEVKSFCIIAANTTSSKVTSQPFDAGMAREYAVAVSVGTMSSLAMTEKIYMQILAATASTGSFTTISGDISVIASGSTHTGVQEARLQARGTVSTLQDGMNIYLTDPWGATFTITATEAYSTVATAMSIQTSAAANLSTCLQTIVTNTATLAAWLESTSISSNATLIEVLWKCKHAGMTFNIASSVTPVTGGDNFGALNGKKVFTYEFKSEDIVNANASYSHFQVILQTAGSSAIPFSANVLAKNLRHVPTRYLHQERGQLSTVSTAYTT